MKKMKVRMRANYTATAKIGDVCEFSEQEATRLIRIGFAEYYDPKSEVVTVKKQEEFPPAEPTDEEPPADEPAGDEDNTEDTTEDAPQLQDIDTMSKDDLRFELSANNVPFEESDGTKTLRNLVRQLRTPQE